MRRDQKGMCIGAKRDEAPGVKIKRPRRDGAARKHARHKVKVQRMLIGPVMLLPAEKDFD